MLFSNKKVIICFIGVDGSGKTTHAKCLSRFLKENGYKAQYLRAASRPILAYPFLILTRILGYWTIVKKDAWTDPLEKASSNARKGLGFLYRGLLFLDFELLMLVKLKPPFNNAQVLVLDRYVYDLIIDLAVTNLHSPFYARMILRMMPKPNIAYFTDASSDVIAERRPNFHKEELEVKITAYRKLARILDFDFISTTREFEENKVYIQKQTLASLEQELGNFR